MLREANNDSVAELRRKSGGCQRKRSAAHHSGTARMCAFTLPTSLGGSSQHQPVIRKSGFPVCLRNATTPNLPACCEHIAEFERAMTSSRTPDGNTLFIWAHAGDAPGDVVSALLAAHSNLYFDLSSRNSLEAYEGRLLPIERQRLDDGSMVLKEEWKTLMETYPDRVMVGTDVGPRDRHLHIVEVVNYYRTLLGQLPVDVADQIAHGNARTIFDL